MKNLISDEKLATVPKFSIWDFDNHTRSRIWGYPGSVELYRHTSCEFVIKNIKRPFLIIGCRDDPISLEEDIPFSEILNNPNGLLALSTFGAHCDMLAKQDDGEKNKRFYPKVVLKYISEISKYI